MKQGHLDAEKDYHIFLSLPTYVTVPSVEMKEGNLIIASMFNVNNCSEDNAIVWNQGLTVDENNDPAKDKIQLAETPVARKAIFWLDNNEDEMVKTG